jgi:hypothetical protein
MSQPEFAYRTSAVVSNDLWLSSRRWEQNPKTLLHQARGRVLANRLQAQSTMKHTKTPCSIRAMAPTGSRGKTNANETLPSSSLFGTTKITSRSFKCGLYVRVCFLI